MIMYYPDNVFSSSGRAKGAKVSIKQPDKVGARFVRRVGRLDNRPEVRQKRPARLNEGQLADNEGFPHQECYP